MVTVVDYTLRPSEAYPRVGLLHCVREDTGDRITGLVTPGYLRSIVEDGGDRIVVDPDISGDVTMPFAMGGWPEEWAPEETEYFRAVCSQIILDGWASTRASVLDDFRALGYIGPEVV